MAAGFAERLAAHGSSVYQQLRTAQEYVLEAYEANYSNMSATPDVAIELPTGVGKTLIALLIADWALDQGRSVAYLTGTNVLADQVEAQAAQLPGLAVSRFSGGNYPGAALDDYHQAQAVGLMNYWVYFNSSPKVQPADLVIFDDAHLAEQALRVVRGSDRPDRGHKPVLSNL
jgi:superfamily II DNA or RNA helicase